MTGRGNLAGILFAAGLLAASPAVSAEMDDAIITFFQAEQTEVRIGDGNDVVKWDAHAWVGNDDHRLAFKSEGEVEIGKGTESAEFQFLYQRPVSEFFDIQVGIRHDVRPDPERTYGVIALQGLAPQFVETDASLFVSETGDVSLRIEVEREFLLTQRLVLQPSVGVNLAFTKDAAIESGKGFNDIEIGLRLRYEVVREFAPYVGLHWERKFSDTARFAEAEGEAIDALYFVGGLRFWF